MDQQHPFFDDVWEDDDLDAQQQELSIFRDIRRGDLEAVQQRVLADGAVLEERESYFRRTPLIYAIRYKKPAIALWIIEHRGQHDLETGDQYGVKAMQKASDYGPLAVVQALVAAGADPAASDRWGNTPLILASFTGHTDIVAFLLQLPAVKATIDAINRDQSSALSRASLRGHQPIVQLLLDTGADPTIPAGWRSPVNEALNNNHHAIAALLRHVIAEADRVRALHKARSLLGAGAAALACLQGRVEQGQALPQLGFAQRGRSRDEKVRATAAFAVGVSGGEKDSGLCEELYVELLGYMLPGAWADKGPAGV